MFKFDAFALNLFLTHFFPLAYTLASKWNENEIKWNWTQFVCCFSELMIHKQIENTKKKTKKNKWGKMNNSKMSFVSSWHSMHLAFFSSLYYCVVWCMTSLLQIMCIYWNTLVDLQAKIYKSDDWYLMCIRKKTTTF